jgi:hypothetical protein
VGGTVRRGGMQAPEARKQPINAEIYFISVSLVFLEENLTS